MIFDFEEKENSEKILRKFEKFSGKALRCNTVPRKLRSTRNFKNIKFQIKYHYNIFLAHLAHMSWQPNRTQYTAFHSPGISRLTKSSESSKRMDTSYLRDKLKLPIQKLPSCSSWNELRQLDDYTIKDISSWKQRREFLLWPPNYLRSCQESTFLPIPKWEAPRPSSTALSETQPTSTGLGLIVTTLYPTTPTYWNQAAGKSKRVRFYEDLQSQDTYIGSTKRPAVQVRACSPTTWNSTTTSAASDSEPQGTTSTP